MPKWTPVRVTGDYDDRQASANTLGAVCYYEQHMNSYTTAAKQYGLVQVAHNASATSKAWATDLAARWQNITGLPTRMRQTKAGGRGNHNIEHTAMPAILGEPGPISHAAFDDWMDSEPNRRLLALAVAESIKAMFPAGGTVALSTGHLGKTSNPRDTGAADADAPGTPGDQTEGWLNEQVIGYVAEFLGEGSIVQPPAPPTAPPPAAMPLLRVGSTGGAVRTLQAALNARGAHLRVDGAFGGRTLGAVKDFQRHNRLAVDGIVGPKTWRALGYR